MLTQSAEDRYAIYLLSTADRPHSKLSKMLAKTFVEVGLIVMQKVSRRNLDSKFDPFVCRHKVRDCPNIGLSAKMRAN